MQCTCRATSANRKSREMETNMTITSYAVTFYVDKQCRFRFVSVAAAPATAAAMAAAKWHCAHTKTNDYRLRNRRKNCWKTLLRRIENGNGLNRFVCVCTVHVLRALWVCRVSIFRSFLESTLKTWRKQKGNASRSRRRRRLIARFVNNVLFDLWTSNVMISNGSEPDADQLVGRRSSPAFATKANRTEHRLYFVLSNWNNGVGNDIVLSLLAARVIPLCGFASREQRVANIRKK